MAEEQNKEFENSMNDAYYTSRSFLDTLDEYAYGNDPEMGEGLAEELRRFASEMESSIDAANQSLKDSDSEEDESRAYNLKRIRSVVEDITNDRNPDPQVVMDQVMTLNQYLSKI